jgi:hypothetical protein
VLPPSEILANQNLPHQRNVVWNFEHPGSFNAKTVRFFATDCLSERHVSRVGPMKFKTEDDGQDRSRFVGAFDIVESWGEGSGVIWNIDPESVMGNRQNDAETEKRTIEQESY